MKTNDLTIEELKKLAIELSNKKTDKIKEQDYEEATKLRALEVDILQEIEKRTKE